MIFSYCRVSTAEQATDASTSLETQERKNRAIAMLRGSNPFDVVNYVDAGVSGSIPLNKRPAGARMLADVSRGDIIVCTKLDRMFRSAIDALMTIAQLRTAGAHLIMLDVGTEPVGTNGISQLFLTMLSAFAEFERTRIAERMDDGRRAKALKQGCLGAVPYGWRKQGSGKESLLVEDADEQAVIARVRAMRETGRQGGERKPYGIAQKLTADGIMTRSGKPFRVPQIQRILERVSA